MHPSVGRIFAGVLVAFALGVASITGASAQAQAPQQPAKDYNQRAQEIFEFRKAAQSGAERGQEIFYYKCWFCHNEFVKDIPHLKGLYQKANMLSGQPVSDDAVREQLRNGSPNMPAYKYILSDADFSDLIAYLREKCCWDSDAPPPNPRFRANKQ